MPRKKPTDDAKPAPPKGRKRPQPLPDEDIEAEALEQAKRSMAKSKPKSPPKGRKSKEPPADPAGVDEDYEELPKKPRRSKKDSKSAKSRWSFKIPSLPSLSFLSRTWLKPAAPPRKGKGKGGGGSGGESLRRWLLLELFTVVGGLLVGLGIAGALVWVRAERDVASYLSHPPSAVPSVVLSAPVQIRTGMKASLPAITSDLLASGFERVERVSVPEEGARKTGMFSVEGDRIELWSPPWRGGKGGKASFRVRDGLVAETSERKGLTLPPTVLGTLGDLESRRESVTLTEVSPFVEPALLAMEDVRFREHHGVDPIGIMRALFMTLFYDDVQGGSTLTQQLAKNLFLSGERTVRRKVREIFFAAALEQQLDKDELLSLYLSEVYLGQMGGLPLYGVDAAARGWFGVSAARLDLHQSALIVGAIPAPNRWSPVRHPAAAMERRDIVLARMLEVGAIDQKQYDEAKATPLDLKGLEPSRIRRAPYAVDTAVDVAEEALGEGALAQRGYTVHTGIQPLLQRAAEEAVAEGMAELDAEYPAAAGAEIALVALDIDDGTVVAMVGGRSYAKSPYNRALHADRQAGSTIKPLTMLKAFSDGDAWPALVLDDAPIQRTASGVRWNPKNYDNTFVGPISVREAIEGSRNIPAILLAERVGAGELQKFYQEAGLSHATNLPSAALGSFAVTPMELASAYTAFHRGVAYEPRVLLSVEDAGGSVVLEREPRGTPVASEQAAALAVDVLQGVITRGTARAASKYGIGPPAVGKTGTTDDYRDAWFVGLTPELVVAVWVGRDEGTLGLAGSRAALPTWARFVAASGTLRGTLPHPDGLVELDVCPASGMPVRDACPEVGKEWFLSEHVPEDKCELHGGPIVRTGRLFERLFGRKNSSEDEEPTTDAEPAEVLRSKGRKRKRDD